MPPADGKYGAPPTVEDQQATAKESRSQTARIAVRAIRHHALMSNDWFGMVDSAEKLARLASYDQWSQDSAVKLADVKGRTGGDTLWDQEQAEDAVRTLVEEAKLSLCVRLLAELKTRAVHDHAQRAVLLQQAQEATGWPKEQIEKLLLNFEESMGFVLFRAFRHVEALQLTDQVELMTHCASVLQHAARSPGVRSSSRLQETMVLHYFSSLCVHLEKCNTGQVLSVIFDSQFLLHLAGHLTRNVRQLPADTLQDVLVGWASLCSNEDFQTRGEELFAPPATQQEVLGAMSEVDEQVIKPVLEQSPDLRPEIRPLLDWLARLRRKKR
mmetsp:Transcript_35124/g.85806  ORF Transcript_35124/g.85806 Transcript_35124/m.85806 type:complete len:327 (+) Transcript_35124:21-1001(+)